MTRRAVVSARCPSCRREVKAPFPNYDLIKQMGVATAQMVEQAAAHQKVMQSHDEELAKTTTKIHALQDKMVARAVKEISENPTDKRMFSKKARELVALGLFDHDCVAHAIVLA